MRYLRVRGSPDVDAVPETFRLLAASEHVTCARAVATKFAGAAGASALFHVDGDREVLADRLDRQPEVTVAETAPASDGFYLLLVLDPASIPVMQSLFEVLAWQELVVVPPVVYRDGEVRARLVGTAETVSGLVEAMPDAVDVAVEAVGERGLDGERDGAAALSDRQREAVEAALALGYYDQPRAATHEDVAGALDCAASTASEHLRKAEAKLVRAAMR